MNSIYLEWQDTEEGCQFPVGRLDVDRQSEPPVYTFRYVNGVRDAMSRAHFIPIPGFWDIDKAYQSPELFPMFQNRVMDRRRPDRSEYLFRLGLKEDADELAELAVSGGRRLTDNFQTFPVIVPDDNGLFDCRYALQRSITDGSLHYLPTLMPGETLDLDQKTGEVFFEGHLVGALPYGLMNGLRINDTWQAENESVKIVQVNPNAPNNSMVLVDFRGKLPPRFRPMADLPQYQPIISSA